MKLSFEFDGVRGTEDLKEKISKKFASLEKYLSHVKQDFHAGMVRVLKGDRWGYKVKVDLKLPGKALMVEGRGGKLMDAIDEAHNKSNRVVRKYLEKLKDRRR